MKAIIFSDSHGTLEYMERAVEKEHPDYIFHLGDYSHDAERLGWGHPQLPLLAVRGNCDYGSSQVPEHRILTLGGRRIYMCHGHKLGVKAGLLRAEYTAREAGADIFLFGHTHIPYAETGAGGLLLLNPGTCSGFGKRTYGLIWPDGQELRYEIKNCDEVTR